MAQNNFSATELLTYANLQIAAEALYGHLTSPAGTIADVSKINGNLTGEDGYLVKGNNHSSKFTTTQAEQFAKDWKVVQHIANTKSGFSGTLFEKSNGELVLSFRSTEFVEDQVRDCVATNTLEIAETGWAFGQISDMEQWFQNLKKEGLIPNGKQITVTGYSLGGHLATAFHILHQDYLSYKRDGNNNYDFLTKILNLNPKLATKIQEKWIDGIESPNWIATDNLYHDATNFLNEVKNLGYNIIFLTSRQNQENLHKELIDLNLTIFPNQIIIVQGDKTKAFRNISDSQKIMIGDTEIDFEAAEKSNAVSYILNRGFRSPNFLKNIGVNKTYDNLDDIILKLRDTSR